MEKKPICHAGGDSWNSPGRLGESLTRVRRLWRRLPAAGRSSDRQNAATIVADFWRIFATLCGHVPTWSKTRRWLQRQLMKTSEWNDPYKPWQHKNIWRLSLARHLPLVKHSKKRVTLHNQLIFFLCCFLASFFLYTSFFHFFHSFILSYFSRCLNLNSVLDSVLTF